MEHKIMYGIHKVKIYGKEQCPHCVKAKNLAKREGHDYSYHQLGIDFEFPEFMDKFPGARTFPQITIIEMENEGHPVFEVGEEKSIGGYTEYEELVSNLKT